MKPSSQQQNEKLDLKTILPILIIVLVDLLGLTIIIPLLPLYATAYGANPMMIGALGAAYPVMQFLGAPLLGRLSDRYGRKPILVISQLGTLAGFLLLGFANTLWLLFISRIIDGISGANIATAQAAISDCTSEKTRTQGLGLIGAAFGLGFTIGPVIAFVSLALSNNNYHVPAFVAAAFSAASILLTSFWFKETRPAAERMEIGKKPFFRFGEMWVAARHPAVGMLLVLMFAQQLAFGGFEQLLSLFTLNRLGLNASGNALIFIFVGVILVTVQGGLIGKWSQRFGDKRLVYAGLLLLTVGLTAVGLTPHHPVPWYSRAAVEEELTTTQSPSTIEQTANEIPVALPNDADAGWAGLIWILVAMVPVSVGGGLLRPAINSLITQRVAKDEVGGMLGISSAFSSSANALAPLIGGAVFQAFGSTAPFLLWGLFIGLLFMLSLKYIQPQRGKTAVSTITTLKT